MQAAAADDFSRIVWTRDLGEIKSEQLVDVMLEQLTTYYLEHQKQIASAMALTARGQNR